MLILGGWRSLFSGGNGGGGLIKDQHKGSNCFVFPESADAGAEMWAERCSQPDRHPLHPLRPPAAASS